MAEMYSDVNQLEWDIYRISLYVQMCSWWNCPSARLNLMHSSAKFTIVWKFQLYNWVTLNSHTDALWWSQMLPDWLSGMRWALSYFETTWLVLLNAPVVVEQNKKYPNECLVVFKMQSNQLIIRCEFWCYWDYWPRLQDCSGPSQTDSPTLWNWSL
jgi:hypothetical protein